jgi:hypothetical protein
MKKRADCIRQTENWSIINPYHKLDNSSFDAEKVKNELEMVAPKMKKLIEHIAELDAKDLKTHGKLFKHMIYSDLKSSGGAKMIGSALISHGYSLIYNKRLDIIKKKELNNKTFAILCSTKIYDKTVGVKVRSNILDLFNKRPDNIYGEELRFIVLDSGFKEGIDLFDIKYIHIMETPITSADSTQIIGRGTRFCGQSGLEFDKEFGWLLHVYIYNSNLTDDLIQIKSSNEIKTMFDIFMLYSNINVVKDVFAKELTTRCIQASIDYELNKNIHVYGQDKNSNFKKLVKDVESNFNEEIAKLPKEVVEKYGKKLEMNGDFPCNNGCKGNVMLIPTEIMLLAWYMQTEEKKATLILNENRPRGYLCLKLMNNNNINNLKFCKKLQDIWKNPEEFILKNQQKILTKITGLKTYKNQFVNRQCADITKYMNDIIEADKSGPICASKIMNYYEMQSFMKKYYKTLKWPEVVMENLCTDNQNPPLKSKSKKVIEEKDKIIFTPSQKTLQEYFTPASAYKGLLIWHSTGTGKTCNGISIASNCFEKKDYTILWVTRNTLLGDIWKNMYKYTCSKSIQENKEQIDLDNALKNPLKYLNKNWMQPITYKQFSNLLLGKNEFYAEMIKRNGKDDPLRKTLIIIDEAHKLLSNDLKGQEKPNFEILHKKILDSYDISKKDSVRIVLMTATPYREDPMHMIQLFNLMRPRKEQFPTNYEDFKSAYLKSNGTFSEPLDFMSKVSGYISYLNSETDVRKFAQPVIKKVFVDISLSRKDTLLREMDEIEEKIDFSLKTVIANKEKIALAKIRLKKEKEKLINECKALKKKVDRDVCKANIGVKEEEFRKLLFSEAEDIIITHTERAKKYKNKLKDKKKLFKNYRLSDPTQERVLKEKCLKQ